MSRSRELARTVVAILLGTAAPALADGLGIGRPALPEEIAAWDIDVRPDGQGLPEGSGDVSTGEQIYTDICAVCHGDFGEAVGRWPQLAGGDGTLESEDPVKTIGSYWPYLSTVWDYVHRAMPFGAAQSLSNDDVYDLTAYILYLNDLVGDDFALSRENFADVRLPNEANFFTDDRSEAELSEFSGDACMENCKEAVEITKRATVLDVTPEDAAARAAIEADAAATETGDMADAEPAPAEDEAADPVDQEAVTDPELVAIGVQVFKKCQACHQVGADAKNQVGPLLTNVFGRAAGTVEGFNYSEAMIAAGEGGLVWTHKTLAEYLADPKSYVKGNKMSFVGLRKAEELEAINAYLEESGG